MITELRFQESAKKIGCSVAAIKAVCEVESKGSGFLSNGDPVILFEPHIFWKELLKRKIDPSKVQKGNEDILYPKWDSSKYGSMNNQHVKLRKAILINREAALCSASWGLFQIMGFNWKMCGVNSLQDFINAIYKDEDSHLDMFDDYIISARLDDELKRLDWDAFALGYNGPMYRKNDYHNKLEKAYNKFK